MGAKLANGIFIIIIFLGVYIPAYPQWVDNFNDNEFISNPAWLGNTTEFEVEGEILRLTAPPVTNNSYLATYSNISLNAVWNIDLRLDFNPSSSNYANIYLMADVQDLNIVQNGYFVKIGGTTDEVSLYKVVDGNETKLIDGVNGRVNLSSVDINLQISRDINNNWELKSKLGGESVFVLEGSVNDEEIKTSAYFGIYCNYTSTRSTKFYFDNIAVSGSPFVDNEPPVLLAYSTPTPTQNLLVFNEALDTTLLKSSAQFLLNTKAPISILALSADSILLTFTTELELINTLELVSVSDLGGNLLDTLLQVVFVDPSPANYRDITINELLPDPNPQEDLPSFEFVELYNASHKIIDLTGWEFTDGTKLATFGSVLIYPDSFLIICPIAAEAEFMPFGNTLGLDVWPTLNNGGDALIIASSNGTIIDSLTYSSSWYNNTEKDDGGWTLEQVNPVSKCLGPFNWSASINENGGTPGMENSLFSMNTDFSPPIITQALLTETLVEVWLTEPATNGLYQGVISSPSYDIVFNLAQPSAYLKGTIEEAIHLNTYSIEIPLQDCNGNTGLSNSILINITDPDEKNIIINEILFDPYSGGSDFVEIYNNSDRYFNLKDYQFSNETNNSIVTDTTLILDPRQYLALSEDIVFLKNEYLAPDSSLFETGLPSMPNDEGLIILKSSTGVTLDSVNYSEEQHFSLINNVEGISLERISFTESSSATDNWRSAAESTRYATPGYKNSQSLTPTAQGTITVSPEIITPNNDGQSDFCQISFSLANQSQSVSIAIYNLQGQLVKNVVNNAIIAPAGFFTWDGTNQQGGVLPTAHYIIVSEIVVDNGQVLTFRNKVVVANGF